MSERLRVALFSLLLTALFFIEYLPPFKRVNLWSDIDGYHYPLLNLIHKTLNAGQLPLWDNSIYSGMTLVGNIQAGLFYPPNWLLFGFHWGRDGLPLSSIELLAFAHVWLTFLFAFLWLRDRSQNWLPAVMGAGVAAFSGYLLSQMTHLGVAFGYAWVPFGLWGIDQAGRTRSFHPLWKLTVASGMCLLAGYPPTWAASCIVSILYALTQPGRWRLAGVAACALAAALLLGAVQVLPALEVVELKVADHRYGGRLPDSPGIYLSLFAPNYYDQNRFTRGPDLSGGDYFYLGASVWFALGRFARKPKLKDAAGVLAVVAVCVAIMENPGGVIGWVIYALPVLPDLLRNYNLLIVFPLCGAFLTTASVNGYLIGTDPWVASPRARLAWILASIAWAAYLLALWPPGLPDSQAGLRSLVYPIALACLLWFGLAVYRSTRHSTIAVLLLLVLLIEYKVFGTNRRFNAVTGNMDIALKGDARSGGASYIGLDDAVYQYMLKCPAYRVIILQGRHPTDMRHYRLATPQGFDPMLTIHYKSAVERYREFRTDRLFDADYSNEAFLKAFGVRFLLAVAGGLDNHLRSDLRFRLLEPSNSYYQAYEYLAAEPAWDFTAGEARVVAWEPDRREFHTEAAVNGRLLLKEQFWPGWRASVDRKPVAIERCEVAFQCVAVAAGSHRVEFAYRPGSVGAGAAISIASVLFLAVAAGWPQRFRSRT